MAPAWLETTGASDALGGDDVAVTRLRPRGRPPVLVAVLLGAIVAVAVVKPWGEEGVAGPEAPPASAEAPQGTSVARPSATPAIEAGIREHCLDPGGWRVFAREGTGKGTIRSWKTLEPAVGPHGPGDDAIPVVPVGAAELQALGYCAPWRGAERPPSGATLSLWTITPTREARLLAIQRLLPRTANVLGGLFVPARGAPAAPSPGAAAAPSGSGAGGWPDGRYVFALRARGYERWWRVDVATGRPQPGGPTEPSHTPPA